MASSTSTNWVSRPPPNWKYGLIFGVFAVITARWAYLSQVGSLPAYWIAANLMIISAAYIMLGPRVYGKRADGTRSLLSQFTLLPYTSITHSLWHVTRLFRSGSAYDQLTDDILIGRRLLSRELPDQVEAVIDLTCEFTEPAKLRSKCYSNFPILDASTPSAIELVAWASRVADISGCKYIHCAEGHGRTGMFSAALLYARGECSSAAAAIELIQKCRPNVRLQRSQILILEKAIEIMKAEQGSTGSHPLRSSL